MLFRYESTELDFTSGQTAPVFPLQQGTSLYTSIVANPYFTTTQRYHGLTTASMRSEGMRKDDRDIIETFWSTTLLNGYYDFTVFDSKNRALFETSWNDWVESWRKMRGGVYSVNYQLESSLPWLPSLFAIYAMTSNDLYSHDNDLNNTLTAIDGSFEDSADLNVLRQNGYALKVTGAGGVQVGASGNVVFQKRYDHRFISCFCQVRAPLSPLNRIELVNLHSGTSSIRLGLENGGTKNNPVVIVYNNGEFARYYDLSNHFIDNDTWTDLCFSYDAVNGKIYIYSFPSGDSSFSNYLDGETAIADRFTVLDVTTAPINRNVDSVELITESADGAIGTGDDVYLQNVMIFDGVIDQMMYNTIRRLCYMWNNKTEQYPK